MLDVNGKRPEDKIKLNKITKELKKFLYRIKNQTKQDYIRSLPAYVIDDYSLWKITKKIERPTAHIAPVRRENNTCATNDKQKAESFAIHFSKIFTPNTETTTDVMQMHSTKYKCINLSSILAQEK